MLTVSGLNGGYGRLQILWGAELTVQAGETVGIFGRNGAGKSTLFKALVNQLNVYSGQVRWNDLHLTRMRTEAIANAGLVLVPQTRGLFMGMKVRENLRLSMAYPRLSRAAAAEREAEVYELLPQLANRRDVLAGSLSGGEQQMLAIAKALVRRPQLLLLDEPTIGLSPVIVGEVANLIRKLRQEKLTLLISEQSFHYVLDLADRAYIMEQGRLVEAIDGPQIRDGSAAEQILAEYLGEAP